MRLILIFAIGLMLFAGCVTEAPAEEAEQTAPPEEPTVPPEEGPKGTATCEEYCLTLPHIQCVGEWEISGTYPDCECEFVCEGEEAETEPPEEETEEPEEEMEEEPYAPTNTQSLDEMMDDILERLRTDFYRHNSGSYEMNTYTWKGVMKDTYPGDITVDKNIAAEVEFDGTVIDSLQASGFISFRNTNTGITKAYGFAIFEEKSPILDTYYSANTTFSAEYYSSVIDKGIGECEVYDKVLEKNTDAEYISTFVFKCDNVYNV